MRSQFCDLRPGFTAIDKGVHIRHASFLTRVWNIVENPRSSIMAKVYFTIYLLLTILAIFFYVIYTVDGDVIRYPYRWKSVDYNRTDIRIALSYPKWSRILETKIHAIWYFSNAVCAGFFTVDYILRIASCPRKVPFLKTLSHVSDVILLLVMWSAVYIENRYFTPDDSDDTVFNTYAILCCIGTFRALKLFRLAKIYRRLEVLLLTLRASWRELLLLVIVILIFMSLFGPLIYIAELMNTPKTFENIPIGMWWSIVTMTTVGYGDVHPKSFWGYVVGCICVLTGIVMSAMPIAIIGNNFNKYCQFAEELDAEEKKRNRQPLN